MDNSVIWDTPSKEHNCLICNELLFYLNNKSNYENTISVYVSCTYSSNGIDTKLRA